MNPRERLHWLLESGGWNVDDSAPALRELDQLLEDIAALANENSASSSDYFRKLNPLIERLAQAGYGEK